MLVPVARRRRTGRGSARGPGRAASSVPHALPLGPKEIFNRLKLSDAEQRDIFYNNAAKLYLRE